MGSNPFLLCRSPAIRREGCEEALVGRYSAHHDGAYGSALRHCGFLVKTIRRYCNRLDYGKEYHMGNVMNAFRLAVVGECKGPHMFDITALLGKEETLSRIQRAIETLK